MSYESGDKGSHIEDAEIIPRFKGVKSWDELYDTFEASPMTTSDGRPYAVQNLNEGIALARSSNFSNFNKVTSSEGLREVVACLLLAEARNLQELSNMLARIESITGSKETFTQAQLLQKIQDVLNGAPPEILTNSYNLRTTVVRLQDNL
jgi:hypothetical protein